MTTTNPAVPAGRIMLKNVRLAFPKLAKAEAFNDGEPKYGAALIMGPDHPQLAEVKAKMLAAAVDKWKDKAKVALASLEKTDKLALHDGDTKGQYDGFPGNFFISANADEGKAPTLVDRDRTPLPQTTGRIYAGCYVNVSLDFWAQDNKYGKRVNAQLRGVQFWQDGDAFSSGRPADSDEFDDVSAGTDAEDFA